jgi:hypothetical protein
MAREALSIRSDTVHRDVCAAREHGVRNFRMPTKTLLPVLRSKILRKVAFRIQPCCPRGSSRTPDVARTVERCICKEKIGFRKRNQCSGRG